MSNQLLNARHIAQMLCALTCNEFKRLGIRTVGPFLDPVAHGNTVMVPSEGELFGLWHDIGSISPQYLTLSLDRFSMQFLEGPVHEACDVVKERAGNDEVQMIRLPPRATMAASEQCCSPSDGVSLNYESAYNINTNTMIHMIRMTYVVNRDKRRNIATFGPYNGFTL